MVFIVVAGIDGCGKSTLIKSLKGFKISEWKNLKNMSELPFMKSVLKDAASTVVKLENRTRISRVSYERV